MRHSGSNKWHHHLGQYTDPNPDGLQPQLTAAPLPTQEELLRGKRQVALQTVPNMALKQPEWGSFPAEAFRARRGQVRLQTRWPSRSSEGWSLYQRPQLRQEHMLRGAARRQQRTFCDRGLAPFAVSA